MKERPILMTPENAQKCFEGVKTQTRRILKDQPGKHVHIECDPIKGWQYWWDVGSSGMSDVRQEYAPLKCPYGVPGDRLWIREAWQEKAWSLTELNRAGFLSAPRKPHETYLNQDLYAIHKGGYNAAIGDPGKWTPSIHMPRWACRTVVEITEIRVHRLQEISYDDEGAEGIVLGPDCNDRHSGFIALWESINGPGSWAENPFVWALTFKKI